MSSQYRLLLVDDFIDTQVCMEIGLDIFEESDGTVSTTTTKFAG